MISFYCDVFNRRSHIIVPLNDFAVESTKQKKNGKKKKPSKFCMLQKHINTFKEAKEVIKLENKLSFPDLTKPFHLYTDVSDIQLGATLLQDSKLLEFYTRKLSDRQVNYTVRENNYLK